MRTRSATSAATASVHSYSFVFRSQKRTLPSANSISRRPLKRCRSESAPQPEQCSTNGFDSLSDDLVVSILVSLSSTASSPGDLTNLMLTCKRLYAMGMHRLVLRSARVATVAVKASRWSDGAHRFLKRCADSGNVEACFILGMIRFFCLCDHPGGVSMMAKAAMASHASALHSLAIIQFNGSGGSRKDKNLRAGATLCARAAITGHVDAMRELGHCLQDGYGVARNVLEGRRLLLEANAREAAAAVAFCPSRFLRNGSQSQMNKEAHVCPQQNLQRKDELFHPLVVQRDLPAASADAIVHHPLCRIIQRDCCSLLSDFGCNVPPAAIHVANKFLIEWFALHPPPDALRLCSHANCGRSETRRHEFRRCSACGTVNYCSRACQALDWKLRHKYECQPIREWEDRDESDADDADEDEDNAITEGMDEATDES